MQSAQCTPTLLLLLLLLLLQQQTTAVHLAVVLQLLVTARPPNLLQTHLPLARMRVGTRVRCCCGSSRLH
jgi:hypothetical protein